MKDSPLILITNDDGITSPGLWAAVRAARPLGQVLVAAPSRQWSGAGRSMTSNSKGRITAVPTEIDDQSIDAYQVDASPALTVIHALYELMPHPPDLLIAGINYGENLGSDTTISGTVGAALQGAVSGVPALAVSLQTPKETHNDPDDSVDFSAAIHFTRLFARRLLAIDLPPDVDVLKVDVPDDATTQTPWRLTRASRQAYFVTVPPQRNSMEDPLVLDYDTLTHPEHAESDSDIYALAVDRVVSVSPLSIDLSSRVDLDQAASLFQGDSYATPKHNAH